MVEYDILTVIIIETCSLSLFLSLLESKKKVLCPDIKSYLPDLYMSRSTVSDPFVIHHTRSIDTGYKLVARTHRKIMVW